VIQGRAVRTKGRAWRCSLLFLRAALAWRRRCESTTCSPSGPQNRYRIIRLHRVAMSEPEPPRFAEFCRASGGVPKPATGSRAGPRCAAGGARVPLPPWARDRRREAQFCFELLQVEYTQLAEYARRAGGTRRHLRLFAQSVAARAHPGRGGLFRWRRFERAPCGLPARGDDVAKDASCSVRGAGAGESRRRRSGALPTRARAARPALLFIGSFRISRMWRPTASHGQVWPLLREKFPG